MVKPLSWVFAVALAVRFAASRFGDFADGTVHFIAFGDARRTGRRQTCASPVAPCVS